MKLTTPLTGSHLRTFDRIFQHPISHNLEWRDVHALFGKLGSIEEESNGNFKVSRNGQSLVLHPPKKKDVAEMDEIISMRHFLERSETPALATDEADIHWLLVIDHHEARVYRAEMDGAVPKSILPHNLEDHFRHAHNSKDVSRGQEKPDLNSFFEPVTKALKLTGSILIFGTGTGTSSEMEQFVSWVKSHHPEVAKRIIGSLIVDEHHLTDGQLLAKAHEFYAKI
jgi:hypothetical protein